jgi:L-seryl-tRNA(Ser) seleniumtransferase
MTKHVINLIYDPYEKYGLKRTINAATSLTTLGGSMPNPSVFEAMLDSSKAFIYIPELQRWAGDKLVEAFGAEAGLPTAGAVNALTLACAACIMRGTELEAFDPLGSRVWTKLIQRLPMRTKGLHTEFVVLGDTRSDYDHAIEATGGKPVEAGTIEGVSIDDLHAAFNPEKTAAYYYTVYAPGDQVSIENFVKVAHSYGVPAIVDAAHCLTHKAVPEMILGAGADLVIFSGGKQLGGPNNSGILLGRRDLIKLAHLQAYPFDGIGRAAKMSRETIIGLIAALNLFLKRDDNAYYSTILDETRNFSDKLGMINGLRSGVLLEPSVCNDVVPSSYAWIEIDSVKLTLKELYEALLFGEPSIRGLYEPFFITREAANRITLKVEYLLPGDKEIIVDRLCQILSNDAGV